ncbi:hypothetical protein QBC40DRAFT_344799 [Triangularia verruculosa]|uniref:tyrosinase n=1 Tax=Triangularia verruculosa TaxID=2587418 RepID=A0AAN7AZE8_9PEZI|nr:hypothetical protein QBC40DRAFT_344799 [Triangularia verruculosa]
MEPMRNDITKLSGQELDRLVRGFRGIMDLEPSDDNSYSTIATYHGLPAWYCQHENVLFPLWHRAYLIRLERALRHVLQDDTFAMPYWSETSDSSAKGGLPTIFTSKTYTYSDGSETVSNPLYSYKLQTKVTDSKQTYAKPVGYETVRYPWSGLVSGKFETDTIAHNAKVASLPEVEVTKMLNGNIVAWLTEEIYRGSNGDERPAGELHKFKECLNAPNYTVFSNNTSAADWNNRHKGDHHQPVVTSLEEPHNGLHLAIGGWNIPGKKNYSAYAFANGDMGDNETAAFDPVFYFHHCFIDYTFWKWQVRNEQIDDLPIDDTLKGVDGLSLDSPLEPFNAQEINGNNRAVTGRDLVNIANLGYSYPDVPHVGFMAPNIDAPKLAVSGINRKNISGSFLVTTWAKGEGNDPHRLLKVQPVLSRWNVDQCKNCLNHLDVKSHVHLLDYSHQQAKDTTFFSLVHTYGDMRRGELEEFGLIGNSPINVELHARDD